MPEVSSTIYFFIFEQPLEKNTMHFFEILTACLRKKLLLITIPLICSVLALGITFLIPKSYYTEIRLRVDDPVSTETSILPSIGKNLGNYFGNPFQNEAEELYLEILSGRENLINSINTFNLDSIYKQKYIDPTLKLFKKDLTIGILDNNLIVCGFRGKDRDLSMRLTRHLVDQANTEYIKLQKERLSYSTNFLKTKTNQLMDSIETLNRELISFYRSNNVINIEKQIELSLLALSSYEEEINSMKVKDAYAKKILGASSPAQEELKSKLRILQNEFRELRGNYNENYKPSRKSVLINADWGLEKMIYEKILTSRISILKDFLFMISKELALSESQLSKNVPAIQIIQDAYFPDWKISPKRSIWMITAFSLGFLFTISYILMSAFLKGELQGADPSHQRKVRELLEAIKT